MLLSLSLLLLVAAQSHGPHFPLLVLFSLLASLSLFVAPSVSRAARVVCRVASGPVGSAIVSPLRWSACLVFCCLGWLLVMVHRHPSRRHDAEEEKEREREGTEKDEEGGVTDWRQMWQRQRRGCC